MNAALSQTEVPAQYLTFTLGAETFALEITQIKEIIEYGHLTPVPMMPEFIRGVINLRGRVVPAIDLKARFKRDAVAVGKRTCIVIIEVLHDDSQYDIGIVVDAVSAVLDIAGSDIEPAPAFGAKIRSDFIQGMAKVEGEFIIILDVAKVLSVDEMVMLAEANQMTPPVQADISR
ncbi:MAG: chemotaxis protein CheW [Pseudomonadales bacterium]|nr:chemotaxis protein CheW [Pseudomonadales bacterium]